MKAEPSAEIRVTLAQEGKAELEEKKSVFIGRAKPVTTEEEALAYIKEQKRAFPDARHHVWAYRLQGDIVMLCSDDGEPQGSACVPVLDAIRKSGVSDAVVVVTRYFGGILLGAGGLVRAYSRAAKLALDAAQIVTCEPYCDLVLSCSYADYQRYLAELPKFGATSPGADFAERVQMKICLRKEILSDFVNRIREMSGGSDFPDVIGEHFDICRN